MPKGKKGENAMRKILSLFLAVLMVVGCVSMFASCSTPDDGEKEITKANIKIGFIFLHDETSTYDKNFIDAAKATCEKLGFREDQFVFKIGVPEDSACQAAAAELADDGCDIVFADSFGHEDFLLAAAKEFPNVQFCHATGTKAHTENLDNFHNAFASIYEGRYLAGVAAGLKLNEMIAAGEFTAEEAKMGYVGAHPYAEVISGYTSFYLGAKSVCPTVTMEVDFTGSWFDVAKEQNVADKLIQNGCKLISQHADSMGAPGECEAEGVPNVSYNGSTMEKCPNTFIVSSKIDWSPYFEYIINCVLNGETIADDWTGTLETGSVVLSEINENVAASGTASKLEEVKAALIAGTIHVFDTNNFTVNGQKLESYLADVDTDAAFEHETEVIKDGIFYESDKRSAPYFDIDIDGIVRLDKKA